MLTLSVGAPYVLISSTGPLLQHWYNRRYAGKSPYRLYALSNFGSLLGLLTYPFLIEPRMALGSQTLSWSAGYLLFAVICILSGCTLFNSNTDTGSLPDNSTEPADQPDRFYPLLWVGLAACGSIMLLGITSKITQDFSVVPFLWVLPLSLYLCTFIIAFDSPKLYRREIWIPAFLISVAVVTYLLQPGTGLSIVATITLYSTAMFCMVMVCHGELVRSKPQPSRLTFFYLMVSLGGALGGAFVNFVAPNVFAAFWELHISIVLAVILVGISLFSLRERPAWQRHLAARWGWSAATIVLIIFLVNSMIEAEGDALTTRRNFYGVLRVHEQGEGKRSHRRKLYHGQINHGLQLLHPKQKHRIVSYFSSHSGLGIAFRRHPKRLARSGRITTDMQDFNLNVGVVGLGIGVIASWGLPGDTFRFYEINPGVITLA
ncbi:MAG: MFS transporter, partial [Deltaproteobacteria bacterium]|nr:MFS transporter [Deltaproteobacteria bacterium]